MRKTSSRQGSPSQIAGLALWHHFSGNCSLTQQTNKQTNNKYKNKHHFNWQAALRNREIHNELVPNKGTHNKQVHKRTQQTDTGLAFVGRGALKGWGSTRSQAQELKHQRPFKVKVKTKYSIQITTNYQVLRYKDRQTKQSLKSRERGQQTNCTKCRWVSLKAQSSLRWWCAVVF